MDTMQVILTTVGGALSATLGVMVGGLVTRRVQERHWLRDRQLQAYQDLFAQYSRFMMELNSAHYDQRPSQADWASWSVSLTSASLVAPDDVARAIDAFGKAIRPFLTATADPSSRPLDRAAFSDAARPAARAHLALQNAIRRSMGGRLGDLPFFLGGTLIDQHD